MKRTEEEQETRRRAYQFLLRILKPGTTVYTICKHMASSGMSRDIAVYVVDEGKIKDISWHVALVTERKQSKNNGGVKCHGCGMDMGFDLVYTLGRRLYPDGFELAKNQIGRNGSKSKIDPDGGYALKQEWI